MADLTADEVWAAWRSAVEDFGYQIEVGGQQSSGGTLGLRDITVEYAVPPAKAQFAIERLDFVEQGGGAVAISISEALPFGITGIDEQGTEIEVEAMMRHSGLVAVASGDANDITYEYSADSLSLGFDKFVVDGEDVEPAMTLVAEAIAGTTRSQRTFERLIDTSSTVGAVRMAMNFTDPDNGNTVNFDWQGNDLQSQSASRISAGLDLSDPNWLAAGGLEARGTIMSGPTNLSMTVTGEESFSFSSANTSWNLDFDLNDDGLAYGGGGREAVYSLESPDLPVGPVTISLGQSAFEVAVPTRQSEVPLDFRFLLRLQDLGISDSIWQLIDPTEMLPRTPSTLIINTGGKLRPLADLFAPESLAADAPPYEMHELEIDELSLSLAGASIVGNGSFAFNNDDLVTFDGMPAPSGAVFFDLNGVNTLINTLSEMGILQDEQLMGALMMLGLFARPAEGEDHMTSEIEVRPDGSVFANGQQLR